MTVEVLKRALSIRQPRSELILNGKKTEQFRSRLTHIRRRIYLYAGKQLATVDDFPDEEAQALPRGAVVGSVESLVVIGTRRGIVLRGSWRIRGGSASH